MTAQACRVLVVDDEPLARKRILKLLKRHADVVVAGECSNGAEAVAAIEVERPDIVFLDVQMPDLDGFGVLEAVGLDRMPVVVFVTAFDEYALKAFDVAAIDYLLKPFDDERFETALARAREERSANDLGALHAEVRRLARKVREAGTDRSPQRLAVHAGTKIRLVEASQIDWIEAEDNYARLHVGEAGHLMRETLGSLETRLEGGGFARVHRSAIVNLDRVREVIPDSHSELWLVLEGGARVKVTRTYAGSVKKRLTLPAS